jgi:chemotaxis protein histidine kinase CheA
MTGAPGFLEFFVLEASEYVEQLDGLLLSGSSTGPDARAMQRVARALRGAATMAKLSSFSEVAAGVERVARALQDGALNWDPALGGALVSAVDDLKVLLHSARSWSPADDQRAAERVAELSRIAPRATSAPARSSAAPVAGDSAFLATEAANIAAGLELVTTRPGDTETASNVLRRIRALRGVASVKEVAALSDTLEATEDAARGLESGDHALSPQARHLLDTAAGYLRTLAVALRSGAPVDAPSDMRDAFAAAQSAWRDSAGAHERIVPIADLFYGDGTPGLVEASPNPPTSAPERFRLELVSVGEHLRQILDGARSAHDPSTTERLRRDLRETLRGLQADAESFGESDVAAIIADHIEPTSRLDVDGLAALEDLASVLSRPSAESEPMSARLRGLRRREVVNAPEITAPEITAPEITAPEITAPEVKAPEEPVHASAPPFVEIDALDSTAAALIDFGIAALDALTSHPFSVPTPIAEDVVVPIESLLYRGRAALDRAVELRDQLRRVGPTNDAPALEELFDLLELAQAE